MGEDKDKDTSVEGSLAVDVKAGTLTAAGKASGITRFFRTMFPEFTAKGRLKHVVVDNIERQLVEGKPLGELTKAEQQVVASALSNELRKAANRERILDRAIEIEPKVAGLFEASEGPKALPPKATPSAPEAVAEASEAADEQQYFWERFWADAEVVSVAYIQEMYAKILAGKVTSPGSFSLKTLDTVRCLDERTGVLFSEVCQYAVGGFVVPAIFGPYPLFSTLEMNALDDAGLMRSDRWTTVPEPHSYSYGPWHVRIKTDSYMPHGVHPLTAAGRELLRMTPVEHTEERAIVVCKALAAGIRGNSICEVCDRSGGTWTSYREYFRLET
jgi:hypothetical protein